MMTLCIESVQEGWIKMYELTGASLYIDDDEADDFLKTSIMIKHGVDEQEVMMIQGCVPTEDYPEVNPTPYAKSILKGICDAFELVSGSDKLSKFVRLKIDNNGKFKHITISNADPIDVPNYINIWL